MKRWREKKKKSSLNFEVWHLKMVLRLTSRREGKEWEGEGAGGGGERSISLICAGRAGGRPTVTPLDL